MNYYNEFDANAADWLENLIKEGLIPNGKVDRRSIAEVSPDDLRGFTQCHWFAGIGGWSAALRLAGWPDDRPCWSGSCPCQPYSLAGKRKAQSDERHLWPEMFRLMRARKPVVTFGEQVTSAIGFGWLDGICDDLETEGYEVGATVLGAFSVGSPHKRSRLYWVAKSAAARFGWREDAGASGGDAIENWSGSLEPERSLLPSSVGNTFQSGLEGHSGDGEGGDESRRHLAEAGRSIAASSSWSDYRIIHCTDGRRRRTGRSVFPLVASIPKGMGSGEPELASLVRRARSNRVMRLKGYGNALCVPTAVEFIRAYLETEASQ